MANMGEWVFIRDATPVRVRQVDGTKKVFEIVFSNGAILTVTAELDWNHDDARLYQYVDISAPPVMVNGWIDITGKGESDG